ncbi:uncharacterized protein LOC118736050 [Rhagoletis pomonella]|uniref:uncharacterized protein LOC118736050 n=1 Tax=Rhagoletis pomonella TaxID=28610 RepID=UPI0017851A93|nr:uncharacterized protein LOC118736050 [Rhagoletis pomonella]
MDEYLRLEHMEPVSEHCDPQQFCYIPHHGVYKESSSTTKLRIVFNASYRNKSGVSLNDCLHVGPKLQNDLASVILKWRTYRIGFMADIEKCYRQILVDPEDTDLQRIVWLNEMGDPTVYRLRTVTYGLNCSPYLTIKVLHSLAKDEGDSFPQAAQVLKHSFYMDDCLHGADDSQSAIRLQKELQLLLERGGFTLRKWNSNSIDFLHSIEGEQIDDEHRCNFDQHQEVKALGLYWIASSDEFIYKVNMTELSGPITKRQQLADVAKIYDSPGWVAPIVITGKIICQQLWVTGCNWDDVIPEPYQTQWRNFRNEIREVEAIKVPRWVHTAPNAISYQLHVFADASAVAYAAITYLRVIAADESVKVSILTAKTKVAPLKKNNHTLSGVKWGIVGCEACS